MRFDQIYEALSAAKKAKDAGKAAARVKVDMAEEIVTYQPSASPLSGFAALTKQLEEEKQFDEETKAIIARGEAEAHPERVADYMRRTLHGPVRRRLRFDPAVKAMIADIDMQRSSNEDRLRDRLRRP